ncbi:tyrosine-type recombinase/integrase [Alkalihalobacterium alkalinitrilicum]|uniref:tyrosine-type recombinase/integrase n=1 Tax=Alkalihalobacterium alkalinitrilicum TaxID=427920 RepID=UPI000994F09D|nr:tyrosine-type recombinase/integrase [Alkalihalobacterium alkalinitrilicum]
MQYVEAIQDKTKIDEMKKILLNQSKRDYLFFVFGINTGLRVTELLQLKVQDILTEDKSVKEYYEFNDEKKRYIYLNTKVKEAIELYMDHHNTKKEDFLFKSKKGNQPITRQQAYRIINNVARSVGIEQNIGTHTLRKTFGYHAYVRGVAISILQRHFNHSTPLETYNYLGIDKNKIEKKIKIDVNL